MVTFSFKNVGKPETDYSDVSTKPYGIKTPWQRGESAGYFEMNYDLLEQIRDNFKCMLMTNHGERVMIPDFGANLKNITFENTKSTQLNRLVAESIYATTSKYMPYIVLDSLEINDTNFSDEQLAKDITLKISYHIPEITNEAQILSISVEV